MSVETPLTLEHQSEIERLLRLRHAQALALSEWSFANLYLFRREHDYRIVADEWPRIVGVTYDNTRHVLPLFGLSDVPTGAWPGILGTACLYPLCDDQVAQLDPARFAFSANRNDSDYVYPAENFRRYRGAILQKKRNLMRQFHSTYTLEVHRYGPELEPAARKVLAGWLVDADKAPGEADDLPAREALELAWRLGLAGYVYFADGHPSGFLLAERLQPKVAVVRFAKARRACKGLAQAMFHHFCVSPPWPVEHVNFEQDLGLENFRQTKLSYQPSALLSKWRARLKG